MARSPIPLSDRTLALCEGRLALPAYDRAALRPGVVHFGVGGFHRAHQAAYLDELAADGHTDWGVVGVSLRHRRMREALGPQGCLYTLAERGADRDEARVVGVLGELIFAPDDPSAVLERLASPDTRLVTMTVTGGAYELGAEGRGPRLESVFDYIAEGLDRRRRAGLAPFSVLSCDNVPDNGSAAREATLRAAAGRGRELARWIEANAAFPSGVVDRITPKTTPQARRFVRDAFGVDDRWPVIAEPFTQWIVEDDFSAGRPPLEDVGVQFVADIEAYERTKKRLLNGSHSAVAYLAYLAGHRRIDEAMADPIFADYLRSCMELEIAPLLDEVPGIDLDDYSETLLERFANPRIGDELARLCERGSIKLPAYLLPSIDDALATGAVPELLSLAVAGWLRYLRGNDRRGRSFEVVDPRARYLTRLARAAGSDPRPLLADRSIFGGLGASEAFADAVGAALRSLDRVGVTATIGAYLDRTPVSVAA